MLMTLGQLIKENLHAQGPCFYEGHVVLTASQIKVAISNLHAIFLTHQIKPGDRVALLLPRGLVASVAIYAVLTYGATYVPLDEKSPHSRQIFILHDIRPHLLITNARYSHLDNITCPFVLYSEVLWLDEHREPQYYANAQDDLAAILYTSGSTGKPKGIALSHRAILSFVTWAFHTFQLKNSDRIASLAPFHFDLSTFDLFAVWLARCKLYFIPQQFASFPLQLSEFFITHQISIWYTVPSMLNFWLQKGNLIHFDFVKFKTLLFAGEVFAAPQLKKLQALLPHTLFYNLFGPTETNVCTYWKVCCEQLVSIVPIGKPIDITQAYCHPIYKTLMVKSPTLFSGYFQAGVLAPPPLEDGWYNTHDVVSQNENADFLYHGRQDRMVKIMGHRVELAEIESHFMTFPNIEEVSVVPITDSATPQIIACYVSKDSIDAIGIKRILSENLPAYMHPNHYVRFPKLPRLSNGKLDLVTITREVKNICP